MFEKASRMKLRFKVPFGLISVEELWDLPLTDNKGKVYSLDNLAVELHKELSTTDTISFVNNSSNKKTEELQLKFDIVKHIIDVRVEESNNFREQMLEKERKEEILGIIQEKQKESLRNKTVEELQELLKK